MADPDLKALLAQKVAERQAAGGVQQGPQPIVPLWKVRPAMGERVNAGQIGDNIRVPNTDTEKRGGRVTGGRFQVDFTGANREFHTPDQAASAFLNMSQDERNEFRTLALQSGLLTMPKDGFISQDDIFGAWQKATGYASSFNAETDKDKWLSPWEAVKKLALEAKGGKGGAYDAFAPRTSDKTLTRDFTSGQDAEGVTRSLESLFNSEMGRAPTAKERAVYQKLVQSAYDKSPEKSHSVTQVDEQGNSTTTETQSGGVDMSATLLDQIRDDPEHQAQAASTYLEATMGALGAITG